MTKKQEKIFHLWLTEKEKMDLKEASGRLGVSMSDLLRYFIHTLPVDIVEDGMNDVIKV